MKKHHHHHIAWRIFLSFLPVMEIGWVIFGIAVLASGAQTR